MIKQTITYTDYNGNDRTEEYWFNLSKAELLRLETTTKGGFQKMLENAVASEDNYRIIEVFEDLIKHAVGMKTLDGKYFKKSKEFVEDFMQSEAYSTLLFDLLQDAEKANAFIRGIMPSDLMAQAEASLPKA